MNYEELYAKASMGDEIALEELIDCAEQGEADAQYLLSCFYEMDGPLKNEEQADYWLDMADYNGNEKAKQKLCERPLKPVKKHVDEDDDSSITSDKSDTNYIETEEEKSRRRIKYILVDIVPYSFGFLSHAQM